MKKAIIFGANGQDGHFLSKILEKHNYHVIRTSRTDKLCQKVSVENFSAVIKIIEKNNPSLIFNLAATSSTAHEHIFNHIDTIIRGTVNILEACLRVKSKSKIFIAGSGLQFLNNSRRIKKTCKLSHASVYACARNSALFFARYYRSLGLKVFYGYLFNHESSKRAKSHLTWELFNNAKEYAEKKIKYIPIIDESTRKEWSHAEDTCEQIYKFVSTDTASDEIIGSGEGIQIKKFIEAAVKCFLMNKKSTKIKFKRYRKKRADYKCLISGAHQFKTKNDIHKIIQDLRNKI